MALNQLGLGLLFTSKDRASGSVIGLTRNVRGLESQSDKTSRALQTGLGGAAALALGTSLSAFTDQAASFEFGLAKVKSIATATADDMKVLRDAAFEAGLKTQFSPQEAVEGLQNLAAAGFSAAESAFLLDKSLVLAQAGGISVAAATSAVATSVKLFNLGAAEQTVLVDKLLKTTNLFKIGAGDLEGGLAKTAAAALLTNQSVDEMLLTMGLIKNVFPSAEESGNSISSAMQGIAKNADLIKSKFKVDIIDPKTGGFRNALDLFVDIDEQSKKLVPDAIKRTNLLGKIFGKRGVKGFAGAIGSLTEFGAKNDLTLKAAASQLRGSIGDAEGTADRFLKNVNSTFQGQATILEGSIQTLMVAIGEPLTRVLQPAMAAAAQGVADMARVVKDLDPVFKQTIAQIALVVSGFLAAGGALAIARAASVIIIPILKSMVVSLAGAALAAAPFVIIVGTLGAAVLGLRDGMGGASTSMDGFASSSKKVLLTIKAIGQVITRGRLSESLQKDVDKIGGSGLKSFLKTLVSIRTGVLQFFAGVRAEFASAAATLGPAVSKLGSAFLELGRALGLVAEKGQESRDGLPSSTFFAAGAAGAKVMTIAIEALAKVLAAVVGFGADVIRGLRSAFEGSGPVIDEFGRALGKLAFNLGLAGESMFDGGEAGGSLGQSLGQALGKILILGIRFATVMTEALTSVVAGFKAMMPVLRPIFEFLAEHIEIIAALMIGRFALGVGVKGAGALAKFAGKLKLFTVGGLGRDAAGQFQRFPGIFKRISGAGKKVGSTFGKIAKGVGSIAKTGFKAATAIAKLTGKFLALVARGIVSGVRALVKEPGIVGLAKAGWKAVKATAALIVQYTALAAKSLVSALGRVVTAIRGIGSAAVVSSGKVTALGGAVGGISTPGGVPGGAPGAVPGPKKPGIGTKFLGATIAGAIGFEIGSFIEEQTGIGAGIGGALGERDRASDEKKLISSLNSQDEAIRQLNLLGLTQRGVLDPALATQLAEKLALQSEPREIQNAAFQFAKTAITGEDPRALTALERAAQLAIESGVIRTEGFMEGFRREQQERFDQIAQSVQNENRSFFEQAVATFQARPINVNIDGRTIATATAEGARENAADGFQPVPTSELF